MGWLVKQRGCRKNSSWENRRYYWGIWLESLSKTMENCKDIWHPGQEYNPRLFQVWNSSGSHLIAAFFYFKVLGTDVSVTFCCIIACWISPWAIQQRLASNRMFLQQVIYVVRPSVTIGYLHTIRWWCVKAVCCRHLHCGHGRAAGLCP
jgi:hypothetical protein